MGAIREFRFVVGPETSTLPASADPTGDSDLVNLGYADKHFLWGREPVADLTALAAIAAADRTDNMLCFVDAQAALYWFDSASSATADGIRIVSPAAGTGRWFRLGITPYSATFLIADWVLDGSEYKLTYTAATHFKGLTPHTQVEKKSGSDYYQVMVDKVTTFSTGNVEIRVPDADSRFDGRITIRE